MYYGAGGGGGCTMGRGEMYYGRMILGLISVYLIVVAWIFLSLK